MLQLVPVTFRAACAYVAQVHRHHQPPRGMKFAIGLTCDGDLVGVAIAGRPVARRLNDGTTIEVTRVATDGTHNANSMLYGASWRAAKAMGYRRCVTYTQDNESGASLRAVGWVIVTEIPARGGWDCPTRPRTDLGTAGVPRRRWEIYAGS